MTLTLIPANGLDKKSITQLVQIYNDNKPPKPVKTFRTKEEAIRRVLALLSLQQEKHAPKPTIDVKGGAQDHRKPFNFPPKIRIKPHRAGTARAKAIDTLLTGKASFEDVMDACGWTRRAAIEGIRLLHTHLGWGIVEENGVINLVEPKK